jgi:signal transduction histidine kinase
MEYLLGILTASLFFFLFGKKFFSQPVKITQTQLEHEGHVLANAPFAACTISISGSILWANKAFLDLHTSKQPASLSDLGKLFGTSLFPVSKVPKVKYGLTLPGKSLDSPRHFTLLRWPTNQIRRGGAEVLIFHEQTTSRKKYYQQASFEHQLAQYLHMVSKELHQLLVKSGNTSPQRFESLVREVESLSSLVLETQEVTRRRTHHASSDLKKLLLTTLSGLHDTFREKGTHVVKTLPHSAVIHASEVEILVLLQLFTGAVMSMLPKSKTLRVSIQTDEQATTLTFSIPEHRLHTSLTNKPFNFATAEKGIPTPYRFWRLQLAISQQIASKNHGSITVHSDAFEGTSYSLRLPAKNS